MTMTNADPQELAKFGELAHVWWDPDGDFRPLHRINPLRLDWIDGLCGLAGKFDQRLRKRPSPGGTGPQPAGTRAQPRSTVRQRAWPPGGTRLPRRISGRTILRPVARAVPAGGLPSSDLTQSAVWL